jgi:hypothetical protein
MTNLSATWLDNQSHSVRAEVNNLIAYRPDHEFMRLLAEWLPVVPCPGLIDLYYDIWHCVPSRLTSRIAIKQVHTQEALAEYLALTERVLMDDRAGKDFDEQHAEGDNLDAVIFWLKRRAGR